MTTKSRRTSEAGFTLSEVLVATAVFILIFTAALLIYDRSNRTFKQSVEAAESQQSTRVAFDKLVSDVRMAGFDYDRDGTPSMYATEVWRPSTFYNFGDTIVPIRRTGTFTVRRHPARRRPHRPSADGRPFPARPSSMVASPGSRRASRASSSPMNRSNSPAKTPSRSAAISITAAVRRRTGDAKKTTSLCRSSFRSSRPETTRSSPMH